MQSGARNRRRGAGPTANMDGKNDAEEDGQMQDIITVATNGPTGKRKRPRAVQRRRDTRYGRRSRLLSAERIYVAGVVA